MTPIIEINLRLGGAWAEGTITDDDHLLAEFKYKQDPNAIELIRKVIEFVTK